jgi:hypothetical protein
MRFFSILCVQVGGEVLTLEVVGEGDALCADRLQLGTTLGDDLVVVLRWCLFGGHSGSRVIKRPVSGWLR